MHVGYQTTIMYESGNILNIKDVRIDNMHQFIRIILLYTFNE